MSRTSFNKELVGGTAPITKVAFVHHKGGTGKTTACLNVAGWLTKWNKSVLVIDLDPQGNATTGLGVNRASCDGSIYDVLFARRSLREVIIETDSGVYLAPSSLDLLAAETHLAGQPNNMSILREKLAGIEKYFDYILFDVPPASTLLMINGIVAAENIVIPMDSGVFAYEAIETLRTLLLDLNQELGVETGVMLIILREFSTRIFDMFSTFEIRDLIRKLFLANNMSQVKIFPVPFSRKIYLAQRQGMPISHYAPFSGAGRAYKRITEEILSRLS